MSRSQHAVPLAFAVALGSKIGPDFSPDFSPNNESEKR
jgi:hypothetical protein